jgi:calnexin
VEEPHVLKGIKGDKGLVIKNPAAHHAISAKFDETIDNKGKTLVVQYEVKLQSQYRVLCPPDVLLIDRCRWLGMRWCIYETPSR